MNSQAARARILELARAEGFPLVRFAPAGDLPAAREAALAAYAEGRLANMAWMTPEWLTRATTPDTFLPNARTLIILALPTHTSSLMPHPSPARGRVARYARGRDYHRVFEKKLRRLARVLRDEFGATARATVDYGPLLERPFAAVGGLGWFGKSTMLLVPGFGPWVLLGVVATDLEVEPDPPLRKSCGACTRCLVACPTGALSPEGHVLDARLCISYHTIENRGPIPRDLRPKFGAWIFGCDECLDSCPVGASRFDSHPDFAPAFADDAFPPLAEILSLDDGAFAERFRGRAIMRAKRDGLLRNACVALGNVGTAEDVPALVAALADASALVRGHAAWALGRIATQLGLPTAAALEARLAIEDDHFVRDELSAALASLQQP